MYVSCYLQLMYFDMSLMCKFVIAGIKHEVLLTISTRYQQHLSICAETVASEQVCKLIYQNEMN